MKKNVKKVAAKAADVAGDFVTSKIADAGARYKQPEEMIDDVAEDAQPEEEAPLPKRYIPPEMRRKIIEELRLTNL